MASLVVAGMVYTADAAFAAIEAAFTEVAVTSGVTFAEAAVTTETAAVGLEAAGATEIGYSSAIPLADTAPLLPAPALTTAGSAAPMMTQAEVDAILAEEGVVAEEGVLAEEGALAEEGGVITEEQLALVEAEEGTAAAVAEGSRFRDSLELARRLAQGALDVFRGYLNAVNWLAVKTVGVTSAIWTPMFAREIKDTMNEYERIDVATKKKQLLQRKWNKFGMSEDRLKSYVARHQHISMDELNEWIQTTTDSYNKTYIDPGFSRDLRGLKLEPHLILTLLASNLQRDPGEREVVSSNPHDPVIHTDNGGTSLLTDLGVTASVGRGRGSGRPPRPVHGRGKGGHRHPVHGKGRGKGGGGPRPAPQPTSFEPTHSPSPRPPEPTPEPSPRPPEPTPSPRPTEAPSKPITKKQPALRITPPTKRHEAFHVSSVEQYGGDINEGLLAHLLEVINAGTRNSNRAY